MSETDARMTIAELEVVVVGGGKGRLAADARNRARTYTNTTSPAVTCAVSYAVSVFVTAQGSNEHLREVTEVTNPRLAAPCKGTVVLARVCDRLFG